MKISTPRIAAWLVLFAFLFSTNIAQADAWYDIRSKCRWYRNKYKTRAWVDKLSEGLHINVNFSCNDRDGGCSLARSNCYWFDQTRTRAYAHASDSPRPVPYTDDGSGSAIRTRGFADAIRVMNCVGTNVIQIPANSGDCHGNGFAGFNRIKLPADQTAYHITKPLLNEVVHTSRSFIYLMDENPIFDEENHAVIIKDVRGRLKMNAQDIANDFTALTIAVTHEPLSYDESEDPYQEEEEFMNNLIWSSTAMLNNGRVLMSGAMDKSFFKVAKNDGPQREVAVDMNIEELVVPIPEDISLDDVSIKFGVDGGNLGYGISRKFAVDQPTDKLVINPFFVPEEVFTFENYPNAVSDVLNVKVELPTSQNITISLSDINGQEVKQLYEGGVGANREVLFQEDLSNLGLKEGVYFLTMGLRNQLLVRKVIIQH